MTEQAMTAAGTLPAAQNLTQSPFGADDATRIYETWEITTEGRVWLQTTTYNRQGQPMLKDVSLGPQKPGQKLKISQADREMNQEMCANLEGDPFRNGLLVRSDADQNQSKETRSTDALSAAQLLEIYGLQGEDFKLAVESLGQLPIRRLRDMAEAVDASLSQTKMLDAVIEERYRQAASQPDAVFDLGGVRRSEREGR